MEKKNGAGVEKGGGGGNGSAAQSGRDALLFIAMCIVGLPVEVQLKDGSLYHGVFHTASFEQGIVLKKATKVRKGKCRTNLAIGDFVDTLVISASDLVQVVVKDLILPGEGISGDFSGNDVEAIACLPRRDNDMQLSASGYLGPNGEKPLSDANNMDCSTMIEKAGEQPCLSVSLQERYIMENMVEGQKYDDNVKKMAHEDECSASRISADEVSHIVPSPVSAQLVDQENNNTDSANLATSVAKASELSTSTAYVSESGVFPCPRKSSPGVQVPKMNTVGSITTKASKLSPSAKAFTPSVASLRPLTSAVPTIANGVQIMPIANPQLGADFNSFGNRTSMPSKLVAYNNLDSGSTNGAQYARPILGHGNIRQEPVRFVGQYHNVQGSPFVNQPSQTVMVGRLGQQLVYMNPIPQDTFQTPVISQGSPHPHLTPYPANVAKIQGSAASAMQLVMNPTIMAGGNDTVLMPNYVPFPQPLPFARPVMASGGTGYFFSKYQ